MAMSPALTLHSLLYYLTNTAVAGRPTAWTLSLHSGDPGAAGTANEVAYSGYARQVLTPEVYDEPEGARADNPADVTFPAAPDALSVTHIVLWGGTMPLVIQALLNPKTIPSGAAPVLLAGELDIGGAN